MASRIRSLTINRFVPTVIMAALSSSLPPKPYPISGPILPQFSFFDTLNTHCLPHVGAGGAQVRAGK